MAGKLKLHSLLKCLGQVKKYLYPTDTSDDKGKFEPSFLIVFLYCTFATIS